MAAATTAGAVEVSSSGEGGEGGYARAEAADDLPSLLLRKFLVLTNTSTSTSISICKVPLVAQRRESSTYDEIVFKSHSMS